MHKPEKILIISSEFPPGPGGIGAHSFYLAKYLGANNYNVIVISESDNATKEEIKEFDRRDNNFKIHRIPRVSFLTYFIRLFVYWKYSLGCSILLFSGKFPVWSINILSLTITKKKRISIVHGSEIKLRNNFGRWLIQCGLQRCDLIICVSEFTKSLLSKRSSKIAVVIPNGIECTSDENSLKKNVNIEHLSLLTVGNLTPRKGQHRVIKSMPEILEIYPKARYHLVGIPTQKKQLQLLSEKLKVGDHVIFHGKVETQKLERLFEENDIFLMLSENQPNGDVEGFGIAILEANSYGIPAIGARGCGIEDAIQNGRSGILVDGDNPEEIADAVQTIILNYNEYSMGAHQWARKHSWENIIIDYLSVL